MMLNLFAWRATLPTDMMAAEDPVGPLNDARIVGACTHSGVGVIVGAWGFNGTWQGRGRSVVEMLKCRGVTLKCFGLTAGNRQPRHPLYLRKDAELEGFY